MTSAVAPVPCVGLILSIVRSGVLSRAVSEIYRNESTNLQIVDPSLQH
jgi:hypothetical protein